MAVLYFNEFLQRKVLGLPAEPFITELFADKSTLLAVFILAPLNEETLFRELAVIAATRSLPLMAVNPLLSWMPSSDKAALLVQFRPALPTSATCDI